MNFNLVRVKLFCTDNLALLSESFLFQFRISVLSSFCSSRCRPLSCANCSSVRMSVANFSKVVARCHPLRLPLAYVFPFCLRRKGKNLQDQIRKKRPHQVFALTGIQKWHIQHTDIHAFFLGEYPPLFSYLLIVAAQPANTQDIQQICLSLRIMRLYSDVSKSLPDCLSR